MEGLRRRRVDPEEVAVAVVHARDDGRKPPLRDPRREDVLFRVPHLDHAGQEHTVEGASVGRPVEVSDEPLLPIGEDHPACPDLRATEEEVVRLGPALLEIEPRARRLGLGRGRGLLPEGAGVPDLDAGAEPVLDVGVGAEGRAEPPHVLHVLARGVGGPVGAVPALAPDEDLPGELQGLAARCRDLRAAIRGREDRLLGLRAGGALRRPGVLLRLPLQELVHLLRESLDRLLLLVPRRRRRAQREERRRRDRRPCPESHGESLLWMRPKPMPRVILPRGGDGIRAGGPRRPRRGAPGPGRGDGRGGGGTRSPRWSR